MVDATRKNRLHLLEIEDLGSLLVLVAGGSGGSWLTAAEALDIRLVNLEQIEHHSHRTGAWGWSTGESCAGA